MLKTYFDKVSSSSLNRPPPLTGSVRLVKPLVKLGKIARKARQDAGYKLEPGAAQLGVKGPYLSRIETGKQPPGLDVLDAIAKEFDADRDEMLALLRAHRDSEADPRIVGKSEAASAEPLRSRSREEGHLPVYGMTACGSFIEAIEADREPHGERRTTLWREAVAKAARSKRAFVVIAEGDSMSPTINDGDELLIEPNLKARDEQIVLVRYEGNVTVKRYFADGDRLSLRPDNQDRKRFPVISLTREQFEDGHGLLMPVTMRRVSFDLTKPHK